MPEMYNIETSDGAIRTRVKVHKSIQYTPYKRELSVSAKALERIEKLAPGAVWYVGPPTPYRPVAVLRLKD